MNEKQNPKRKKTIAYAAGCALIVLFGAVGMMALASLKKPPVEAQAEERAISVRAATAGLQDYPVTITGYGQARCLTQVAISSEVSGRVVETHPLLKVGQVIPKGESLFQIDVSDYTARLREARAGVAQWKNTVARLEKQLSIDRKRLKTIRRSAELAKSEFQRVRDLFVTDQVGTRSGVDQEERAFNTAWDQADAMAQTVSLYPLQIREAQSSLHSAQARLTMAQTNLARCQVKAPFAARLKSVNIETGQYVAPGTQVLTLADDTILEIQVPLDSRDARNWLQFEEPAVNLQTTAWFGRLKPVACTIRWTEDKTSAIWHGTLNRVVEFDNQTRTLTVAVRISAADAGNGTKGLPLVDGMFCAVEIPGRIMKNVIRLPRQAVTFDNKVFLADADNRLKTVLVDVVRSQGKYAYISRGIKPGDRVIVTRLIDPLENSLLTFAGKPEKEPAP
ncbi:MAG: efflux RND transporter periplasmic adaptor subunit [Desulfobacterales bacterium]|nr:efflux RND transporter periplasmic adaptor subunit [Desulfobacterales bacterium]